jgi:hypothetical protein
MGVHAFIDESKRGSYVVVAAVIVPGALDVSRAALRSLLLPGQRRLHFNNESDARRRGILAALGAQGVEAWVYESAARREADARDDCLTALVFDLAERGATRAVVELAESWVPHDRRVIRAAAIKAGIVDEFRYDHLRAHEKVLLAAPDAVAWCWARGRSWRAQVRALVTRSTSL